MEAMLENLDLKNLDKTNWKTFRFEEIADKISQTVNPEEADVDVYVGLEHLDAEDIHIRRKGVPSDVKGGKLRCSTGDVIFGKRRAYQRKSAIVDFEGICSAHAFVFRAKSEVIDPKLFPFFLHSDQFMHRMVDISVGGLSPTINWGDLRHQEFLLPPKEEQAKLAELLWAMDEVIESEVELKNKLQVGFRVLRKSLIQNGSTQADESQKLKFGLVSEKWKKRKVSNFCQLIGGNAFKSAKFKKEGKIQVLRIGNLTDQGFDFSKSPVFVDSISPSESRYLIPKGAVVLSLTGTNGKRDYGYPSLMEKNHQFLLNQRLLMLIPDSNVMTPEFLYLLCKMELFQAPFFLNATGTANQANVSSQDVGKIWLPIPSLEEQIIIVVRLNKFRTGIESTTKKIRSSQFLQKSLINQIF